MVGVSYGKNATLPDEQVRWLTPEEIEQRVEKGERIRFFDARDVMEDNMGSLPGAESLAQSSLMFAKQDVQPILDDLLANFSTYDVLIFFANTAGPNSGITSGRDVYVMAYLHELGVPPLVRLHLPQLPRVRLPLLCAPYRGAERAQSGEGDGLT